MGVIVPGEIMTARRYFLKLSGDKLFDEPILRPDKTKEYFYMAVSYHCFLSSLSSYAFCQSTKSSTILFATRKRCLHPFNLLYVIYHPSSNDFFLFSFPPPYGICIAIGRSRLQEQEEDL